MYGLSLWKHFLRLRFLHFAWQGNRSVFVCYNMNVKNLIV